nr:MAG: hypothetical protein [Bacteriophage sp.]
MVFNNHASNQDNNRNDNNNSHKNNKAHKEAMSLRWTSKIQYPSDDKTNPAEAGFKEFSCLFLLASLPCSCFWSRLSSGHICRILMMITKSLQ